jgi:hypothetical protein
MHYFPASRVSRFLVAKERLCSCAVAANSRFGVNGPIGRVGLRGGFLPFLFGFGFISF